MWVGNLCASLDEWVWASSKERKWGEKNRDQVTDCEWCGWLVCVCIHNVGGWHVYLVSAPLCGVCFVFRCVCTLLCFTQPGCALPLLTRPLLFSSLPLRQYAGAPPQSFIGSYYPLTQIQYASIDCVEKQSGSPQQRSKQSKFNKTPPPAFSLALIAPPREEQMYLCEWIDTNDLSRGHSYC